MHETPLLATDAAKAVIGTSLDPATLKKAAAEAVAIMSPAADARGEHAQADFDRFMERYGDLFPDHPQNLDELVDSLISRMAAAERLLRSLSEEQRQELAARERQRECGRACRGGGA